MQVKQVNKKVNIKANVMVNTLLRNEPETTFNTLQVRADNMYGTNEGAIIDQAIYLLLVRADKIKSQLIDAMQHIDTCVLAENIGVYMKEDSIDYWGTVKVHIESM